MNINAITLNPICPTPTVKIGGRICVSVTVVPGPGSITLQQFTTLMEAYNAALPSYASEEEAIADGKVAGDEWLWADDTDVGIAGDKHIQRT